MIASFKKVPNFLAPFKQLRGNMSHVHNTAKKGFGLNSNDYDTHRPRYAEEAVKEIVDNIPKQSQPSTILEIGSGTGIFTRALLGSTTNEIKKLIAAEPSQGMRETCRGSLTEDLVQGRDVAVVEGTFESIDAEDNSYDLVIIAQAYHWCTDYQKSLSEIARVLKPQGKLALTWNMEDRDCKNWVGIARDIYERYDEGTPQYRLGKWKAMFDTDAYKSFFRGTDYNKYTRHVPITLQGYRDRQATKSFINVLPADEKEALLKDIVDSISKQPDVDWINQDDGSLYIPYLTDLYIVHLK